MGMTQDIGKLITSSPEVREGRPRVAGTGVSVHRIALWYKMGLTPEEIPDRIGHLNLAQVYAALTYYHLCRDEIEADLVEDDRIATELEAQARQTRSQAMTR
jgi:uncharacterized protein (DUF433 family)